MTLLAVLGGSGCNFFFFSISHMWSFHTHVVKIHYVMAKPTLGKVMKYEMMALLYED